MDYAVSHRWSATVGAGIRDRGRHGLLLALIPAVVLASALAADRFGTSGSRGAAARAGAESEGTVVPLAARGTVSSALGAGEPQFRVQHTGRGNGLVAINRAQDLRAAFTPAGLHLSSGGSHLGLRVTGYGFGRTAMPLPVRAPSARANRVTYADPGFTESYANGPLGLEQTFTIAHPNGTGGEPLSVSMTLSGNLHATLTHGVAITFSRAALTPPAPTRTAPTRPAQGDISGPEPARSGTRPARAARFHLTFI